MIRVLQVTTHDVTVRKTLSPLIDRLTDEGYHVVSACAPGPYTPGLMADGYQIRPVVMDRRISPSTNARTLWQLYRLMRRETFDIVHVHTPVAAALGRIAALLAGIPIVIYTAHGFYFHDRMSWHTKKATIWIEKFLGRLATHMLFTQSGEDAATAVALSICPEEKVHWIGNGVDIRRFDPRLADPLAKRAFGLPPWATVVGFMGRIVREKGVLELLDAMPRVLELVPNLHLLMAGDITDGERDRKTRNIIRGLVEEKGLASRVVFTGFVEDVPKVMQAIDLFVLPSHREGMPRSLIEAMASGRPVVATNIRGCREEVVDELTGLLVPVEDSEALSDAIVRILLDPTLARLMGDEGRRRTEAMFDERDVIDRQVQVYQQLVKERLNQGVVGELNTQASGVPYGEGREIGES